MFPRSATRRRTLPAAEWGVALCVHPVTLWHGCQPPKLAFSVSSVNIEGKANSVSFHHLCSFNSLVLPELIEFTHDNQYDQQRTAHPFLSMIKDPELEAAIHFSLRK